MEMISQAKKQFIKNAHQLKQELENKYQSESFEIEAQMNLIKNLQKMEMTTGDAIVEEAKDLLEQLELFLNQYRRKMTVEALEKLDETFRALKKLDCFKQCFKGEFGWYNEFEMFLEKQWNKHTRQTYESPEEQKYHSAQFKSEFPSKTQYQNQEQHYQQHQEQHQEQHQRQIEKQIQEQIKQQHQEQHIKSEFPSKTQYQNQEQHYQQHQEQHQEQNQRQIEKQIQEQIKQQIQKQIQKQQYASKVKQSVQGPRCQEHYTSVCPVECPHLKFQGQWRSQQDKEIRSAEGKSVEQHFQGQWRAQQDKEIRSAVEQQIQSQLPRSKSTSTITSTNKTVTRYTIDLQSNYDEYLLGHRVQNKPFYPASAFIYLVWKTLAKMHGFQQVEQFPVQFSNLRYLQHISLSSVQQITFQVEINRLTGLFEVTESGKSIVTGIVEPLSKLAQMKENPEQFQVRHETLSKQEVYTVLKGRGYNFTSEFQPIAKANATGTYGELSWNGKWIAFLDGMIQMNILAQQQTQSVVPTLIKSLRIEPSQFIGQQQQQVDENNNYQQTYNQEFTAVQQKKQFQWISKFEQSQEEKSTAINVVDYNNLSDEQLRLFGELEVLFSQVMQPQGEQMTTGSRSGAQFNYKLALVQQQLEHVYALIATFEGKNEQSVVIQTLIKSINDQIKFQNTQQNAYKNVLSEQRSFNELLQKQIELLCPLTQSQCRLSTELKTLQTLEKFIQEQQFMLQFKQDRYKQCEEQWSQQVKRQQNFFDIVSRQTFQRPELKSLYESLEKSINQQLQQELDFQTENRQQFEVLRQKLATHFNLIQKVIALSNAEEMGCDKDALVKKMYITKLEQLINEMYEQNTLQYAIQQSLYEALTSQQAQMKEFYTQVEKYQGRSQQVRFQQYPSVFGSVQEWKRSLEQLQQEAAEFIQMPFQSRGTFPVWYNAQTKTIYCHGIEMVGLYFAPLIQQTPSAEMTKQEKRRSLPLFQIKEFDLVNLKDALHSLETINENLKQKQQQRSTCQHYYEIPHQFQQQTKPVVSVVSQVTYSPLRKYMSFAEDAELELIEETLKWMTPSTSSSSSTKKTTYLMPQKTIVPLNQTELYQVGEYKQIPVVIIHPIEGRFNSLKNLARYIQAPVYGIQYTRQAMQYETVEQLAQFYLSKIEAQFGSERVHLVGHEFGSLVAFEMASVRPTRFVSLALVDDNTPARRESFQQTQENIEFNALYEFYQQYFQQPMNKFEFRRQFQAMQLQTFNQRVKYVVREIMNRPVQFDAVDLEYAIRSFVNQRIMQNQYFPVFQSLRIPSVTLIKSNEQLGLVQIKSKLQSFLEASNANIVENFVHFDFESMLEGSNASQVAQILNENFLYL